MFNGYRMKINGVEFNDSYIQQGTYSCVRAKRVIQRWQDANLVEHELCAPTKKATLKFQLREHNSADHAKIISMLQSDDNISIEYYSDREDRYYVGIFRCDDIIFSHINLTRNNIMFARAQVTLTEH